MEMIVAAQQSKRIHPHKFTLWVAIASIIMMFAGLTSAFIVKSSQVNWQTIETPKLFWYSTAAILLSSLTIRLALQQFRKRNMQQYRMLMLATAVLGTAFVIMQWLGFQQLWNSGVQFSGAGEGQFLYIIAGLHALHVLGGIVALLVMTIKAFVGNVKTYSSVGLEVMNIYWHFVDILWLYLLIFFIWIG